MRETNGQSRRVAVTDIAKAALLWGADGRLEIRGLEHGFELDARLMPRARARSGDAGVGAGPRHRGSLAGRMSYRVLCADPPWKFGDRLPGATRGAERNYPCLTVEELERFPLPPLADDAHLFLWRVASMQEEALRVVRAWGFVPKAEIVWLKRTSGGRRWFGMGRQVRMEHEVCLIATRGRPKVRSRSIRSTFEAAAGRHSEKPEVFYDIVEQLCDDPYAELFARRVRPGWACFGHEIPAPQPEAAAAERNSHVRNSYQCRH